MQENVLHSVWKIEQEILDVIDAVCKAHDLRYSLMYGTLIGAVRHGGFIPWDDDIDIMMPREDYNRLIEIWADVAPEGYILVNKNTNDDYTNNFTKIVKDHTTFLQDRGHCDKSFHKGIFVDIFPCDRIAPTTIGMKMQYFACAIDLLYTRGYTSGSKGLIGLTEKVLLSLPKFWRPIIRESAVHFYSKWNGHAVTPYMLPCTISSCKKKYPSTLFDDLETMEFNNKEYSVVSEADRVLRTEYGDYMKLPPVEERVWKHHPILIDFYHNYEEIDNQNVSC